VLQWRRLKTPHVQPHELLEDTPLIDLRGVPDLVTDQLLPRIQEHSSMDAGELAENGRITKYMVSFF
jgi:hypothetical protein